MASRLAMKQLSAASVRSGVRPVARRCRFRQSRCRRIAAPRRTRSSCAGGSRREARRRACRSARCAAVGQLHVERAVRQVASAAAITAARRRRVRRAGRGGNAVRARWWCSSVGGLSGSAGHERPSGGCGFAEERHALAPQLQGLPVDARDHAQASSAACRKKAARAGGVSSGSSVPVTLVCSSGPCVVVVVDARPRVPSRPSWCRCAGSGSGSRPRRVQNGET